jgi:hypothetical protein
MEPYCPFTFRPGLLVVGADLFRLLLVGVGGLVNPVTLDTEFSTEALGVVGLSKKIYCVQPLK